MLRLDINVKFGTGVPPEQALLAEEARIIAGLQDIIAQSGPRLKEEAVVEALLSKSGAHYPGQPNRSSAPGESPARQSGTLLDSIKTMLAPNGLSQTTGPTVDYAVYLREGLGGPQNARPIMEGPFKIVAAETVNKIVMMLRGERRFS